VAITKIILLVFLLRHGVHVDSLNVSVRQHTNVAYHWNGRHALLETSQMR